MACARRCSPAMGIQGGESTIFIAQTSLREVHLLRKRILACWGCNNQEYLINEGWLVMQDVTAGTMGFREVDRAGAAHPMLEVKRVTLDDGLHASLILENGRISKLVSPSGEVAVLKWEGDQISPRPSAASASRAAPPRCALCSERPCPEITLDMTICCPLTFPTCCYILSLRMFSPMVLTGLDRLETTL